MARCSYVRCTTALQGARSGAKPPPEHARRLILHADDFGLSRAATGGILRAFRDGVLTSTAVLSNAPAAAEALAGWKHLLEQWGDAKWPSAEARRLLGDPPLPPDLGVHLNLTHGRPLTEDYYPAELLDDGGRFPGVWRLFFRLRRAKAATLAAVKQELARQIELVLDHGIRPTHLNGHQYVELMPAIGPLLPALLGRYGIAVVRSPIEPALLSSTVLAGYGPWLWLLGQAKRYYARKHRRRLQQFGYAFPDATFGTVHAGRITSVGLVRRYLHACTAARWVEIACHPGEAAGPACAGDDGWADPLAGSRPDEARLLISAELVQCIAASGCRLGRLQQLVPPASGPRHLTQEAIG